jgi:hypothetical protein
MRSLDYEAAVKAPDANLMVEMMNYFLGFLNEMIQ